MPKMGKDGPPTGGGGGGNGDFIRHVRLLNDRESCVIRFLTEYEDFYWEEFHRVMEGSQFKGMKICVNSALGQACVACNDGDKAGTQFLGWVQELYHDYIDKPSHLKDEDLEEVQVGKRVYLREQVNAPRLMRASIMHFNPIKFQWDEEDTLMDREFKWVRIGEKGSKRPSYILKAGGESKLPKDLKELAASLPELEDIAFGRVETMGGEATKEEDAPKTRKVSKASKAAPVEDDDDDDEKGAVTDPFDSDDDI